MSKLTIHDLGWTREYAAGVRMMFAGMAEDWDDPEMDVYDDDVISRLCADCETECWCAMDITFHNPPTPLATHEIIWASED